MKLIFYHSSKLNPNSNSEVGKLGLVFNFCLLKLLAIYVHSIDHRMLDSETSKDFQKIVAIYYTNTNNNNGH